MSFIVHRNIILLLIFLFLTLTLCRIWPWYHFFLFLCEFTFPEHYPEVQDDIFNSPSSVVFACCSKQWLFCHFSAQFYSHYFLLSVSFPLRRQPWSFGHQSSSSAIFGLWDSSASCFSLSLSAFMCWCELTYLFCVFN